MKPIHTTLLASAFLAVTYVATPAPALAGGWRCQAQFSTSPAAKQVDDDLDAAIHLARKGYPVVTEVDKLEVSMRGEDFTWLNFPDQCLIQELMDAEIADLQLRAANFRAHEEELRQMQFQIVLARYERAVAEIELAWKNGEFAQDIAEKAIYELRVEAFDYLASLGTVSIRARLQEAITVLVERGMNAEDRAIAQQEFFVKVYTVRLEAALAVLQDRVTKGTATKADMLRIPRYVAALQRLQTFSKPYECGS
jgi:hypothetical protein